ncbi:MAG: very short patch repair endonuclease [Acidobacteriota bacterium]|nr:very short patch repair endonuclease [Acidobacteriota bacterium]
MDKLTKTERSLLMSRVRSKDSRPELIVRSMVHRMGFRYRLHASTLPGSPDLVFAGRKKIVFVHGCFWHGHSCRAGRNRPESNQGYWDIKLKRNMRRDRASSDKLRHAGWSVLRVWECQTRAKQKDWLAHRLGSFLRMK